MTKRLILLTLTLLSAGCTHEWRNGELWLCDTTQTSLGPVTACQPTGIRAL